MKNHKKDRKDKKLTLKREVLRRLTTRELAAVVGGTDNIPTECWFTVTSCVDTGIATVTN